MLIGCPLAYGISLKQLYPLYFGQILLFWVTCGVKMMSLCHGWGWQPPLTASIIHIRHMQSVWAHIYTVLGHTAAALNSYTHTTWVRFWGSGSLVESKWCHYVLTATSNCFMHPHHTYTKWLSTFICFPWAYGRSLKQLPTLFGVLGHLWSQNDAIMSWLRLTASSNCFPHLNYTYKKCLSTLICCPWVCGSGI
jgi:hypothetical protein